MVLELADRFQVGDHVLLKGLPHWVRLTQQPDLPTAADAAVFFMKLHRTALAKDLAIDGDIELLIHELDQLRRDPQGEVRRQLTAAIQEAWARHAPATLETYERWFGAASAPGHVSDVSSHFLGCWNAATRFQRGSEGDSE